MYRKISKSAEALLDKANEVLKESKSTEALLDIPWHWRHEVEIVYLYLRMYGFISLEDPSENMHCAFLGYPCVIINVQCAVSVLGP